MAGSAFGKKVSYVRQLQARYIMEKLRPYPLHSMSQESAANMDTRIAVNGLKCC